MDPVRTCIGCGRKGPKREFLRFVARDGELVHDEAGRLPGRGAYTCRRLACFERAQTRRAFGGTLRASVRAPVGLKELYEAG